MAQHNMSRMEAVEMARRIQDLPVGEQAKRLARAMLARREEGSSIGDPGHPAPQKYTPPDTPDVR